MPTSRSRGSAGRRSAPFTRHVLAADDEFTVHKITDDATAGARGAW
ncbi:hypothetical protein [Streptomyces hokutonensis]|nr:hypothetical protein [Streptomyces hokutonensis]